MAGFVPPNVQFGPTKLQAFLAPITEQVGQATDMLAQWKEFKRKRDEQRQQMAAVKGQFPNAQIPSGLEDPNFALNLAKAGDTQERGEARILRAEEQAKEVQGRFDTKFAETQENALKTRLNNQKNRMINDPRIKPLHAQGIGLQQIGEVENMAKGGNTVASSALGVKMARGMGEVGVLTESDITRYVQSGRLDRKAADVLSKWFTGTPSDATLNEISQIASVLRDSFSEKIQPIYNEYIESFSEVEGKTPDEISRMMAIPYSPAQLRLPQGQGGGQTPPQKKATMRWNPTTGRVEPI